MIRDQGTVWMEEQARDQRIEEELDAIIRQAVPKPNAHDFLYDNRWALLEAAERVVAEFRFTREFDPETGEELPPADQTIAHEIAADLEAVVRAAKGYRP